MIRSLRGRLFLAHLLVMALAIGGAGFFITRGLHDWLVARGVDVMWRGARIATSMLADSYDEIGTHWPAAADSISRDLGVRVTLVAPDGHVLGDSDLPPDRFDDLYPATDQPEVASALRSGRGVSVRPSALSGAENLFVAARTRGGPVAVIRLAQPMNVLLSLQRDLLWRAAPPVFLALLLAALLVLLIIGRHTRRVTALEGVAVRLAADERGVEAEEFPPDELGRLGRGINQMALEGRARLAALQRERDEHEHILAHMSDGVVLLDADGCVVRCNHSLAELLDAPRPAVAGTRFTSYARVAELHDLVLGARASGRPLEMDVRLWAPRGRLLHASAIPFATAEVAAESGDVLLVLRDLTEVERLGRVRQDFVANVSHELRTPLTSIRGYAETLLEGGLEDDEHRIGFVETIRNNAVRLEALAADLLTLAELERPGETVRGESFDLRALVETQTVVFRARAHEAALGLEVEPGPALPIEADRPRIEQVLANLIDNALKYTEHGGVRLRLGQESGRAWCEIEDSGPGVPDEDQPRIFERFYRVDKARSRAKGGTGLGLSIVKNIVSLHHGEVSVRSANPHGSIFRFEIPAHPGFLTTGRRG